MSVLSRVETGAGVMDGSRGTLAPPRPAVLWGIALAGVGAAACTVALRLTSDHGGAEPGLQAALLDWIVCSYILSGLIAWWRRPESRLGPLMVAGGLLDCALEPLDGERAARGRRSARPPTWSRSPSSSTSTSPSRAGVLEGRLERALVSRELRRRRWPGAGRADARRLRPRGTCSRSSAEPDAAATLAQVQLTALAVICLGGVGVLAAAAGAARPPAAALRARCSSTRSRSPW